MVFKYVKRFTKLVRHDPLIFLISYITELCPFFEWSPWQPFVLLCHGLVTHVIDFDVPDWIVHKDDWTPTKRN